MKVAIPIWNRRISPVFDTACRIVVTEIREECSQPEGEYDLRGLSPEERVRRLQELGITTLICGAVSNHLDRLIESAGIRVVPWVSGEFDEIMEAFSCGSIGETGFLMPGCRRRRHERGSFGGGGMVGRRRRRRQ